MDGNAAALRNNASGHPTAAPNEESQRESSGVLEFRDSTSKFDSRDEELKLDSYGIPLSPQPSRFRDDPLNWPVWLKWAVLLQVAFMGFLGPFNAAIPNASLVILGEAFDKDTEVVAYSTTTVIILGGVSPFVFTPLANIYGRRPVTLLAVLLTILGQIGAANSKTFPQLVGTRAITGIGKGGMMSVGTTCLNDMFFMHERGEKSGVYTLFITNGAHFAVIMGGFIAQHAGWYWDFYTACLITVGSFILALFCFPETLFSRDPDFLANRTHERSYCQMLFDVRGNMIPGRRLRLGHFFNFLYMFKYPSISFSFWFYTWSWGFINVLPALSMAEIYTKRFGFEAGIIGVCTGLSLFIGTIIGECFAGKISDIVQGRLARSNNNTRKPEHRLYLTGPAMLFMFFGMVIFGLCTQQGNNWITPLVGLAVGCLGLQIASTCLYAYISDCYRPQTPESAIIMNFSRGITFVIGFFNVRSWEALGFDWAWVMFGFVLLAFWLPILSLMIWGERWRNRLGKPTFNKYN